MELKAQDETKGGNNVFVIIPAFNETTHIRKIIEKAKEHSNNIIVVDDGSRDETYRIAKDSGVTVLRHIINLGKGAALKTGCDYAYMQGAGIFVVMDADGQHEPEEIPNFVKSVKENDVIFGYRVQKQKMPFERRLANTAIDIAIRSLFNINVKDTQSGFRAFTRDAYKKLRWESSDYCVETEMIANTGKHKLKYGQIPISTIYVDKYKGAGVSDAFKITINLLKWRLVK